MSNILHRAGITPVILRQAAYYACLGVGSYRPKGYALFDRVEVVEGIPWETNPTNLMASTMVLRVEFFQGTHRFRWLEFNIVPSGFGGDPIMKQV